VECGLGYEDMRYDEKGSVGEGREGMRDVEPSSLREELIA